MEKKYEIVSLGCNCLPRTVLTRGGVKPSKKQGELSCPFDLVKHPIDCIIKYLNNDFDGYLDDLFFEVRKRNFLDFRKKGLWQKTDGTKFFHDKDCKISDREKLETRIKNRINNFRQIIKSDTPILFVFLVVENAEKIEELYKTLKRLCPHKKFSLAVIDLNYVMKSCPSDIHLLQLTEPIPKFDRNWNKNIYRNTKLGKYVEKNICCFVENILKKDFC